MPSRKWVTVYYCGVENKYILKGWLEIPDKKTSDDEDIKLLEKDFDSMTMLKTKIGAPNLVDVDMDDTPFRNPTKLECKFILSLLYEGALDCLFPDDELRREARECCAGDKNIDVDLLSIIGLSGSNFYTIPWSEDLDIPTPPPDGQKTGIMDIEEKFDPDSFFNNYPFPSNDSVFVSMNFLPSYFLFSSPNSGFICSLEKADFFLRGFFCQKKNDLVNRSYAEFVFVVLFCVYEGQMKGLTMHRSQVPWILDPAPKHDAVYIYDFLCRKAHENPDRFCSELRSLLIDTFSFRSSSKRYFSTGFETIIPS